MRFNALSILILFTAWATIVLLINPAGEFMVNDDWSYTTALELLKDEGKLAATGWGPSGSPGGAATFGHVIWGLGITKILGYSQTNLRISVLIMGFAGSIGLWALLRHAGASAWPALIATLTLIFNPLFLSQSFTFMTDITFLSITIFSMLLLFLGIKTSRLWLVVIGFMLALIATLTRQFGLVIPFGFVLVCMFHPKGRELGKIKILLSAIFITLIPWLAFEFFLSRMGSTPITQHQVFHNILADPISKGFIEYSISLISRLFIAMSYTCFLVLPVLLLKDYKKLRSRGFGYFFIFVTILFLLFEAVILTGLANPPAAFRGNIIYNFGIGPILLKDVYILGIQRTAALSSPFFYLVVYCAILAMVVCFRIFFLRVKKIWNSHCRADTLSVDFLTWFCLLMATAYIGIILLTGFHDRYLIPVCAIFIIWLVSEMVVENEYGRSALNICLVLLPLILFASFSVAGTRDFMQMKRSLFKAHNYLQEELKKDPCEIDGGFEFNGYHCYENSFSPEKGHSWWWVSQEDFLVTLGPLPDYETIRTFSFDRVMGPDGAIHVLKRE